MPSNKCNTLSLNGSALYSALENYYVDALQRAEDKLIEIMREEIQRTTNGGAPGKPSWRNEISSMLRETYRVVANGYIEAEVGVPYEVSEGNGYELVRAMLIAYGGGSAAGGEPITAGPHGRSVWNENLDGKHPSRAESTYQLPSGFNQRGNNFVENAMKRMNKHFNDILKDASASIPASLFYDFVSVHS